MTTTLGIKMKNPATTNANKTVSIFPVMAPNMEENRGGILNHKTFNKLIVAVVVRIPKEILINF